MTGFACVSTVGWVGLGLEVWGFGVLEVWGFKACVTGFVVVGTGLTGVGLRATVADFGASFAVIVGFSALIDDLTGFGF